ncbi:hypothetical protein EGM87_10280 [Sphingobium sp. RSMS]|nr:MULTISPECIES: hypothetical protein [Sphingobium]UXC89466.1 hypothetical protein EGM87_10280 [Sphingobium sp. RSMS]
MAAILPPIVRVAGPRLGDHCIHVDPLVVSLKRDRLRQTTYYDRHIPENAYVEIASLDGMVTIFAGHTLQILFLIVDFPVSVHMHEIIGKEIVKGSQVR